MQVVKTKAELRAALRPHRGGSIGFIPTMGFLHEGHLGLMRAAGSETAFVVVSIFVNPTQFGPTEDLDRYPRDEAGDRAKCEGAGVDLLWIPSAADVYDADHSTTVTVSGLTRGLCGAARPGHFDGVATIVAKLFNLVRPDRAYFGRKDYQQLVVIRRMVRDLDLSIEIVGMPIAREPSGLAMSSRNDNLDPDQRLAALQLSRSLAAVDEAWRAGQRDAETLRLLLHTTLGASPAVRIDYAEIVDPDDLHELVGPIQPGRGALAAVAAFLGKTRLIDNRLIGVAPTDEPARPA